MSCYFRYMKDVFAESGISVNPQEQKRDRSSHPQADGSQIQEVHAELLG
jgi:hypothetical protein